MSVITVIVTGEGRNWKDSQVLIVDTQLASILILGNQSIRDSKIQKRLKLRILKYIHIFNSGQFKD